MNFATPTLRYFVFLCLLVWFVVSFFWHDIKDASSDALLATIWDRGTPSLSISDDELTRVQSIGFEQEKNNIGFVSVSAITLVERTSSTTTISVRIDNTWRFNEFPSLRVSVFSANGALLTTYTKGSSEYVHGTSFRGEVVTLALPTLAQQSRYTVVAFYPEGASR